ncbi:hypothetical protein GCM10009820_04510 [Leifsonia soli]
MERDDHERRGGRDDRDEPGEREDEADDHPDRVQHAENVQPRDLPVLPSRLPRAGAITPKTDEPPCAPRYRRAPELLPGLVEWTDRVHRALVET